MNSKPISYADIAKIAMQASSAPPPATQPVLQPAPLQANVQRTATSTFVPAISHRLRSQLPPPPPPPPSSVTTAPTAVRKLRLTSLQTQREHVSDASSSRQPFQPAPPLTWAEIARPKEQITSSQSQGDPSSTQESAHKTEIQALQHQGITWAQIATASTSTHEGESTQSGLPKPVQNFRQKDPRVQADNALNCFIRSRVSREVEVMHLETGVLVYKFQSNRPFPLGFQRKNQFAQCATELYAALRKCHITDAIVGVLGSSVSGANAWGREFDQGSKQSDIDVFVESAQLTAGFKSSGNIPGFVHPGKIMSDRRYADLLGWRDKWEKILKREVSVGGFFPGCVPQTPVIVVIKK